MCNTTHITTYAALGKGDPTRTSVLRQTFVRDVNRRFNRLKKDIRITVGVNDALGLGPQVNVVTPKNAFNFPSSADKVDAFMRWFRQQASRELLSVGYGQELLPGQQPWTNMYITDSYERGIARANAEARKAGYSNVKPLTETGGLRASMATPFHADRLGLLYSRTFNELKGITAAMDSQISRVLTDAIANGDSPRLAARKLVATISGGDAAALGITDTLGRYISPQRRAQTMARTEIIRAHHQATINEYESWAIEGIKVKAEWSTAGDARVCEQCSGMEGNVYTLSQVRGMIPVHPNCRCLALPIEVKEKASKKKAVTSVPTVPAKKRAPRKTVEQKVTKNFKKKEYETSYNAHMRQVQTNYSKLSAEEKNLFNELYNAETLTREQSTNLTNIYKKIQGKDYYEKIDNALYDWMSSTQREEALRLKYAANSVEKGLPESFYASADKAKEIATFFEDTAQLAKWQDMYIQQRATEQYLMKVMNQLDDLVLYRGVGGDIGEKISMNVYNGWKKGRMRTSFNTKDMPLIGYTDKKGVAFDFGRIRPDVSTGIDRITYYQRRGTPSTDIFVNKQTFAKMRRGAFESEAEYINLGQTKKWDVKDMFIQIDFEDGSTIIKQLDSLNFL